MKTLFAGLKNNYGNRKFFSQKNRVVPKNLKPLENQGFFEGRVAKIALKRAVMLSQNAATRLFIADDTVLPRQSGLAAHHCSFTRW